MLSFCNFLFAILLKIKTDQDTAEASTGLAVKEHFNCAPVPSTSVGVSVSNQTLGGSRIKLVSYISFIQQSRSFKDELTSVSMD